jgi:hypothetical protein
MKGRAVGLALAIVVTLSGGPASADFVIYDGSKGTTPDAQGWLYETMPSPPIGATQKASGGVTILDTTPSSTDSAGYFGLSPLAGTLDRNAGFTVTFTLQIDREAHSSNDRAGFSVIVLGSDAKGLELGFWSDQVWAQNDSPLFTHGEGAAFDTTKGLTDYALTFLGNSYTLTANGQSLLSGAVRDYSSFGPPYTLKNFVFMGDDTSSAAARAEIARVTVGAAVPEPSSCLLLASGGLGLLGFLSRSVRRRGPPVRSAESTRAAR